MPLFRTKRYVVEAQQFDGTPEAAEAFGMSKPDGAGESQLYGFCGWYGATLYAAEGDWIITGSRGERYSLKEEVFGEQYEPVEDRARTSQEVEIPIAQFIRGNKLQQALDDAWVVIHVMHQAGKEVLSNSQHFREVLSNAEKSLSNTQC